MADYRIEELAHAAGTTVRNVRAYRDRGLLPPPRREGRLAFYGDAHLARLRLIAALLERGYTLANVGELLEAWHQGRDLGEMLGLESVIAGSWGDEPALTMSLAALKLTLAATPRVRREGLASLVERVVDDAVARGVAERDPRRKNQIRILRPRLFEAGLVLLQAGVPLPVVTELAARLDRDVDRIAEAFVGTVVEHVVEPMAERSEPDQVARLAGVVERLRPLALRVVAAELGRALERRVHDQLGEHLSLLAAVPAPVPPGPQRAGDAMGAPGGQVDPVARAEDADAETPPNVTGRRPAPSRARGPAPSRRRPRPPGGAR